jgi:peptidoglycan/LPS O-acetylase OafA/YrhL
VNPTLSIWLDLCRIVASLVVFIGHSVAIGVAPSQFASTWHRTADDAVVAFFVISGLVISHTTRASNGNGYSYALARLSRVYSVALPAVLFALMVDLVGMRIDATHYSPEWQYPKLWLYLPLHWLFLGETWLGAIHPFTMAPYWSLGYEVWYYVLFGCLTFLTGPVRWLVVAAVLLIMGPRIWLLMPTWWLGVLLQRNIVHLQIGRWQGLALMGVSLAGYALFLVSGLRGTTDAASQQLYALFSSALPLPFDRGSTVHVLSDYVVAALFGAFAIGCASSGATFGNGVSATIRLIAGYTFTFYLIHFTLLVLCRALGFVQVGWFAYGLVLSAILATTWALGQAGELRRNWYRSVLAMLLGAVCGRRGR